MEEERDVVVFSDDDGNEIELDVIDYFEHEGEEYAILMDLNDHDEECDCDDCAEQDVFIMKVVVNGDMEEFLPAEEEKMEALSKIAEDRLAQQFDGCGCCEGDCSDCE